MVAQISGFVLGLLAVFVATTFTLYQYGNLRKQHVLVTGCTLIAWYFSFIIVFILPLDVSSTMYRECMNQCHSPPPAEPSNNTNITIARHGQVGSDQPTCHCEEPWTYLPEDVLLIFWKIVYWSSQILTWFVLPVIQSYSTAGEFTVLGKLKSAVISNLIYYGSYLVIFCICLIYVAATPNLHIDSENLKVIGITASNTWGLFLLVLLYGYGLVDIPRSVWQASYTQLTLHQTYFKISKNAMEASEAKEKYEDTLDEVRRAAEAIKYNHPLRQCIDVILSKCPEDFRKTIRRNDDYVDYNTEANQIPTEKQLVKMHINVISVVRNYHRTQAQRTALMRAAIRLEDDMANISSTNQYYVSSLPKYDGFLKLLYSPRLVWWWRCVLRSPLWKLISVLLAVFSLMVIWSECVFFITDPVLSLFALFLNSGKEHSSYVSIEVMSILVMSYLCVCAFRTVFKIRIFNYYYLALNHHSDEYSLLFSAMLLSRLTPPLCLNFLSLVHLDSHVTRTATSVTAETAYTKIMGHMDVISFIANGFNIYFPIGIVLLCLATCLRLGSRFLHCIGFEQFIDDDLTQETIDEGRNHVQRDCSHCPSLLSQALISDGGDEYSPSLPIPTVKSIDSLEKLQRDRQLSRVERADNWRRTLESSQIGNSRAEYSGKWMDYQSCQPDTSKSTPSSRFSDTEVVPQTSSDRFAIRRQRSDDRINIMSDQDVVEYNPNLVSDDLYQQSQQAPARTRGNRSNIFDDI